MRLLIRWHRWLGVLACLAVILFAGSGLLHPLLSRTQPRAVHTLPPDTPEAGVPLTTVLTRHGIRTFRDARLVGAAGRALYRITLPGGTRYFDAADGSELEEGERIHAAALARHFSGDAASALSAIEPVYAFDDDYLENNRLLPVWRVRFDRQDGLTAYVDTAGNRLATLVDARKRPLQSVFRLLHNFGFLNALPGLRLPLMATLLFATFSTALAGVVMAVRLSGRRHLRPARRWHRRLALAVAVTTFSFSISGTWHMLAKEAVFVPPAPPESRFHRDQVGPFQPAGAFSLLQVDGRPCYRLAGQALTTTGHHHHHDHATPPPGDTDIATCLDAATGAAVPDADRRAAESLARHYAGSTAPVRAAEPVERFGGEYGFINKRLPVWRVELADSERRWYVETTSGALALLVDDSSALAGWVFAYFHKWSFFREGWQDLRDLGLMLFALGNIAVALLGLTLLLRGPRRAPAA